MTYPPKPLPRTERYCHHGFVVTVRSDLRGRHRDFCLCHQCPKFAPGTPENCPIAQATYENCVKHGITTPVWECPEFPHEEQ